MLKKGTIVYDWEYGYYNYIYPIESKKHILEEDAIILKEIKHWIHDRDYQPYYVNYKGRKILVWTKVEK